MNTYRITYPDLSWECKIEIDPDFSWNVEQPEGTEIVTTAQYIKLMVDYWTGCEDRLFSNDGDYIKTFLQQLANEIITISIANNYNINGVVSEFENKEGWCEMDGSYGIKILEADEIEFYDRDFEVLEI